jgi:hypothetical protein
MIVCTSKFFLKFIITEKTPYSTINKLSLICPRYYTLYIPTAMSTSIKIVNDYVIYVYYMLKNKIMYCAMYLQRFNF